MNGMHPSEFDLIADRDIEVDYDFNPTQLYIYISNSDWSETLHSISENPIQARIWVVKTENKYDRDESTCRFLPLHSTCAREPPLSVVSALLKAYPEGAAKQDDNGMYPLHYACANRASPKIIQLLLNVYSEARFQRVKVSGALPIHLAAQWGVSSILVMKYLLKENNSLASARDSEGLSPLELIIDAEHVEGKLEMINTLKDALLQESLEYSSTISSSNYPSYEEDKHIIQIDYHSNAEEKVGSQGSSSSHDSQDYTRQAVLLRREVAKLKNHKACIKSNVKEQISLEWEAVNLALHDMQQKMTHLKEISTEEQENTAANIDPFKDDTLKEKDVEKVKSIDAETILAENKCMGKELEELGDTYDSYLFKVETVEHVIKELANTMTYIATGHNATITRMKKMESEMIRMSQLRSAKLKELTQEVDAIATKLSSIDYKHEERRALDVLSKEQEILDKMGDIIDVLKS